MTPLATGKIYSLWNSLSLGNNPRYFLKNRMLLTSHQEFSNFSAYGITECPLNPLMPRLVSHTKYKSILNMGTRRQDFSKGTTKFENLWFMLNYSPSKCASRPIHMVSPRWDLTLTGVEPIPVLLNQTIFRKVHRWFSYSYKTTALFPCMF